MPAHRTTDGNLDHAPVYIRAVIGVSRKWVEQAPCRGAAHDTTRNIWLREDKESVVIGDSVYTGAELTQLALLHCQACPVQWDCARFGLTGEVTIGTFGMHFDDLRALKKLGLANWSSIIDEAEASEVPVQVAARTALSNLLASPA